ncbi:MAG: SAM-dependent methyltransferase, partial [Actinobacteria bacterium]|nr:SAM-dependent methyltransferase [Actinomycetota bacterium]
MSASGRIVASGRIPDGLLRAATRGAITQRLLAQRLRTLGGDPLGDSLRRRGEGPIAVATDEANDQHYAVAPEFFELVLGPRLKYSSCLYGHGTETLA